MPSERWQQLEQLFAEAVALPVDRREAFVEGASGADSGLRDELTALLATVERAGPFLSSTALDVFARQISREGWSVRPGDTIGSYAIERRLGSSGRRAPLDAARRSPGRWHAQSPQRRHGV